ncbi:MAG TPA: hypothetical protein VGJ60_20560 [Chloroflexota bacterium]|jgi:hypothetical protein
MTIPETPPPPPTIGTQPKNADEINGLIGTHLRGFASSKVTINQDHAWLDVTDLKGAPYYFSADQEATIKSAIGDLDTALDQVDMTFISRIIGI